MTGRSCTFTLAITQLPGTTIMDGWRAVDSGAANLSRVRQHPGDYVDATGRRTGETGKIDEWGGWAPCHAGENSPWKASGSGYSSHARTTGPSATCRASKTAMPVNPRT